MPGGREDGTWCVLERAALRVVSHARHTPSRPPQGQAALSAGRALRRKRGVESRLALPRDEHGQGRLPQVLTNTCIEFRPSGVC